MTTTLRGRLVQGQPVAVQIAGRHIEAVIEEENQADNLPYIAPGFVDMQVNGYGGFDLQSASLTSQDVAGLTRRLWAEGVTSYCPTITTHSHEHMAKALSTIAQTKVDFPLEGQSIAGIHMEGPFVSQEDGPRGAHPREYTRLPDYAEYRELQTAAHGLIRIVTLAPELPGAPDLIRQIAHEGVVAAIGHCNADQADIKAAVDAGARLSTHLGNGSHQMLHRHRNYIWEQLAADDLSASLITDTHHLPAAVVISMLRAKGLKRVVIISDSAFPGGLAPGLYENTYAGGFIELRPDGYLGIPGTGNLAGSASSIRQCLAGAATMTGLPLADLLPLVTEHPAQLLELNGIGRLKPGAQADLVLFRLDGNTPIVEQTILRGETVYKR